MADDQAQFETLLQSLMSSDNDVRSQSEVGTKEPYLSIDSLQTSGLLPLTVRHCRGSRNADHAAYWILPCAC